MRKLLRVSACLVSLTCGISWAQPSQEVVDVPTRPGVTNRVLHVKSKDGNPKALVLMMAGGHGGLQMFPGGSIKWGENNFLIRTRQQFAEHGVDVVIVDAPSDRQNPPFLNGFRMTHEHATDVGAIIKWARRSSKAPVWVVGTSSGTWSAAYAGIQLQGENAPDGIVLTSTILSTEKGKSVPEMSLERIKKPVLVVHHKNDACDHCKISDMPKLMARLNNSSRLELITVDGGVFKGNPCEAEHYHGFNGIEPIAVKKIADWIKG